jgi:hypothetical protein
MTSSERAAPDGDDERDLTDADRGFVARLTPGVVRDPAGRVGVGRGRVRLPGRRLSADRAAVALADRVVNTLSSLGLPVLIFLAGYEIEFDTARGDTPRRR